MKLSAFALLCSMASAAFQSDEDNYKMWDDCGSSFKGCGLKYPHWNYKADGSWEEIKWTDAGKYMSED